MTDESILALVKGMTPPIGYCNAESKTDWLILQAIRLAKQSIVTELLSKSTSSKQKLW